MWENTEPGVTTGAKGEGRGPRNPPDTLSFTIQAFTAHTGSLPVQHQPRFFFPLLILFLEPKLPHSQIILSGCNGGACCAGLKPDAGFIYLATAIDQGWSCDQSWTNQSEPQGF